MSLLRNLLRKSVTALRICRYSSVSCRCAWNASYFQARNKNYLQTCPKLDFIRRSLVIMKINSQDFWDIFTPELNKLLEIFKKYNHEIRLAGGPVRDLLMQIKPHDLDFATTATPDEMKDIFTRENIRMINMKGEKHGTITVRINDKENFEITTLRIDVVNHGRHAEVEFTKDWELDAGRRDLTINSMFMDFDGTVYDYFGGREDVEKRRVVFVGDARQRIQEDFLRILRYFRFYARVSDRPDSHEPDTLEAIRENADGLGMISGERIWMEMKKILSTKYAGPIVEQMEKLDLLSFMGLPNELNLEEFRQVWARSEATGLQLEPVSLMTALLNTQEEAVLLRERLKYTTFEKELSMFLIQHRGVLPDIQPLRPYQMLVVDNFKKQKDAYQWVLELLKYQGHSELVAEFRHWNPPRFPVSGNALKDLNVPVGKSMNLVIQRLRNEWKKSDFQLTAEQLIDLVPPILEDLGIPLRR